jgi:TIM-barrel protein
MTGFEPRVAIASLSGEADSGWAQSAAPYVGCAFLGGIALDEATRNAARKLLARDRNEFLPDSPIGFIDRQLSTLDDVDVRPAFNVRSATRAPLAEAATVCADRDAIVEINAHCRQDEMCAAGAGQSLLRDGDRLREQVRAASETGAVVSVKLRTEVDGVDLPELSSGLVDAGADVLHVDAMDSEPVIAAVVSAAPDAFVIANNGVRDRGTVHEYLGYGADAVSVGRPSDDPRVLQRVRRAVDGWFETDTKGDAESTGATPDA